ncbi:hypothetical protein JCM13664_15550 [Methylothermus subterraneus]
MKPNALPLFLILSACAPLATRRPPPALHDFGPPPAVRENGARVDVTAPPWLQDTRLRYRLLYQDPTRIRFYAEHRWIAPPPVLLAHALSFLPAPCSVRLHVHLYELEQVFDTPTHSRIVLGFWVEALRADGQGTAKRFFRFNWPTPSADVQGAVAAYAETAAQAIGEIKAWLDAQAGALSLCTASAATAP